ncbi:MAG: alpha/beta hydrolase, partial [Dokdonella sp.]
SDVPVIPEANRVAIAANAKDFTIGTLAFTSCDLKQPRSSATTAAFCAPFAVPEDRNKLNGRKIDMRLALIKADNAVADGFIFFIAGGPGQSAVDNWPQIAAAFGPLRKNRHVILLDQRGIGGSNGLECAALPDESTADHAPAVIEQRTRECLNKVSQHSDPSQYTTTAAIEDIEALRVALGGPTLDLVGVSYGTRVAQQYLMRHPDGVRSVVLDSVAPNSLVLGQEFSRNLDDALKAQFANCTNTPACKKAFGNPMANLLTLRDRYKAEPQKATVHDPIDFSESPMTLDENVLATVARMHAYSPETAALLPLVVSEALQGNTAPLLGQAKILSSALEELSNSAMQLSVVCSEDVDRMKVDPAQANSLLGNAMIGVMQQQCAIWPKGTRPADFNAALASDKPILILEGELDPVTPPRYGEEVMKGLSNAKLIVAKGQGHNVIGRGCIPKVVGKFVSQLAPTKLDVKCVEQLGPIPAFISFSGATP